MSSTEPKPDVNSTRASASDAASPSRGDDLRTFEKFNLELLSQRYEPDSRTTVYFTRYRPNGAVIILGQNDNELHRFAVRFRTLPTDSSGVFHTIEHSLLMESPRLPGVNVFAEANRSEILAASNATTYNDATQYFADGNRFDSVANMARLLIESTLKGPPSFEAFVSQHGYLRSAPSSELGFIYRGVVHGEMLGEYKKTSKWNYLAWAREFLGTSPYSCDSGGDPHEMLDLTMERVRSAYQRSYSAAGCAIAFFGNAPIGDKLEVIVDALKDKPPGASLQSLPQPTSLGRRSQTVEIPPEPFPVTAPESQNRLRISWKFPRVVDPQERFELLVLTNLLSAVQSNPLFERYKDLRINNQFLFGSLDALGNEDVVTLCFINSSLADIERTKLGVEEILRGFVKEHFSSTTINPVLDNRLNIEDRSRLTPGRDAGVLSAALFNALRGEYSIDEIAFADRVAILRAKVARGETPLEDLLKKYLLDNPDRLDLTLCPNPEIVPKWQDRLAQKIRKMCAGEGHLAAQSTEATVTNWLDSLDHPAAIANVPLAGLPEKLKIVDPIEVIRSEYAGAVLTYQPQPAEGQVHLAARFDVSDLPPRDMNTLKFLARVMIAAGSNTTKPGECRQRLNSLCAGLFYDGYVYDVVDPTGSFISGRRTLFELSTTLRPGQFEEVLSILQDLLRGPNYSDRQLIRAQSNSAIEEHLDIVNTPGVLSDLARRVLTLAMNSSGDASVAMGSEFTISNLRRLRDGLAREPEGVFEEFRNLHARVFRRENLILSHTADPMFQDLLQPAKERFVDGLPSGAPAPANYERFTPRPGKRIGVITSALANDSTPDEAEVNYVTAGMVVYDRLGRPWTAAEAALLAHTIMDRYLAHAVRELGGAYGSNSYFEFAGNRAVFASWQDPNVAATLTAFNEAALWLQEHLSEDLLARAKVTLAKHFEPLTDKIALGNLGFGRLMRGETEEYLNKVRSSLFDATIADVRAYADALVRAQKNKASVVVYGSKAALEIANGEGVDLEIIQRPGL